jgi:hypothetical protein
MQRDGTAEFEVCDAAAPEAAPAVERLERRKPEIWALGLTKIKNAYDASTKSFEVYADKEVYRQGSASAHQHFILR